MTTSILTDVLATRRNVINLDRATIEQGDIATCADHLKSLVNTRENVLANNGSVSILVSGYDSQPRQPFEIPEVRRYFRQLEDREPQWFHLCNRIDGTLKLIFMCTSKVSAVASLGERTIGQTFDRRHLRSFLMRHYHTMKGLHQEFDVPQTTSENISGLVISYFNTMTANMDIALQ